MLICGESGFFMQKLNYTPLTGGDLIWLRKLHEGYYRTNFGWLHKNWIKKGIEWNAIKVKDKKTLRLFTFHVMLDENKKTSKNFNMWCAYVLHEKNNEYFYRELHSIDEVDMFLKTTTIRTEIPRFYLDSLVKNDLDLK